MSIIALEKIKNSNLTDEYKNEPILREGMIIKCLIDSRF